MILKIRNILKRRKVKMFLTFLLCSGLIWFIDNLSESYIETTTFELEYSNIPDSLLLKSVSKKRVDVKLQANGFQFLGFNIKNKVVNIDLSSLKMVRGKYFIEEQVYRKQIDKQLRSMTLLEIDRDTLFFEFSILTEKKVPVISKANISLPQNYILDGGLVIEPDSISIKGPIKSIEKINYIETIDTEFPEESTNFEHSVKLFHDPKNDSVTFSVENVLLKGIVTRFSEKMIEVPIKVINLPDSVQIRTFPDRIQVLCRAKIDDLKNLDSTAFTIIADYSLVKQSNVKSIGLKLDRVPEKLHSAQLVEKQVEFILKRQ